MVGTDLELPGAIPLEFPAAGEPDVVVTCGGVPRSLEGVVVGGPNWQMAGDCCLIRVSGVVSFLIKGGGEIRYEPHNGADDQDVVTFLISAAFGILLHQRGLMVLHAAAVKVGDHAVAFCGRSGAGKSTLAAELGRRGYQLVTDDLCVVAGNDERPVVFPDGRQLKLWDDAVAQLRMEDQRRQAVRGKLKKFYVAPSDPAFVDPLPLAAIYELVEARLPVQPGIKAVNLPEGAAILRRNYYQPRLIVRLRQEANHFDNSVRLMRTTRLFSFARLRDVSLLKPGAEELTAHWKELGLR